MLKQSGHFAVIAGSSRMRRSPARSTPAAARRTNGLRARRVGESDELHLVDERRRNAVEPAGAEQGLVSDDDDVHRDAGRQRPSAASAGASAGTPSVTIQCTARAAGSREWSSGSPSRAPLARGTDRTSSSTAPTSRVGRSTGATRGSAPLTATDSGWSADVTESSPENTEIR